MNSTVEEMLYLYKNILIDCQYVEFQFRPECTVSFTLKFQFGFLGTQQNLESWKIESYRHSSAKFRESNQSL